MFRSRWSLLFRPLSLQTNSGFALGRILHHGHRNVQRNEKNATKTRMPAIPRQLRLSTARPQFPARDVAIESSQILANEIADFRGAEAHLSENDRQSASFSIVVCWFFRFLTHFVQKIHILPDVFFLAHACAMIKGFIEATICFLQCLSYHIPCLCLSVFG